MKRVFQTKEPTAVPFLAAAVECKFAGADGVIAGYGSVFNNRDAHGDTVAPGAFAASLAVHKAAGTMPAMLWQHDSEEPIGVWEQATEDGTGLKLRGKLNLETQRGREAQSLVKQGALNGLSIGFLVERDGVELDPKTGLRRLVKVDLWEVSLVTFPSNARARLTRSEGIETRSNFETFLRESGFAKAAARKLAAGGWPALSRDDGEAAALLDSIKSATNLLKGKHQ